MKILIKHVNMLVNLCRICWAREPVPLETTKDTTPGTECRADGDSSNRVFITLLPSSREPRSMSGRLCNVTPQQQRGRNRQLPSPCTDRYTSAPVPGSANQPGTARTSLQVSRQAKCVMTSHTRPTPAGVPRGSTVNTGGFVWPGWFSGELRRVLDQSCSFTGHQ